MHDTTRVILLEQANALDAEVENLQRGVDNMLNSAAELDAKAADLRRSAETLRADAAPAPATDLRHHGQVWPGGAGFTYVGRRSYDPRPIFNEVECAGRTKEDALDAIQCALAEGDLVAFSRSTSGPRNEDQTISLTVRHRSTHRS